MSGPEPASARDARAAGDDPTHGGARPRWMALLARASAGELAEAVAALAPPPHRRLRGPETGLVMLRGRAGGTGERFNLGEMTVSRCTVALADGAVGHAYVGGTDLRHAELAALLDALLQDPARRPAIERDLLEPLAEAAAARRQAAADRAAATRVDFFTLVRGEG
jgi:alpha-D-ribose 1-methylphosphonate 5-triphosphate synthase subunit PhnG